MHSQAAPAYNPLSLAQLTSHHNCILLDFPWPELVVQDGSSQGGYWGRGQIFWQMKFGSCGSLRVYVFYPCSRSGSRPSSSCTETSAMSSHQAPTFALLHMLLFWLPRTSFRCSGEDYSRLASRRGAILPCLKGLGRVFVDMVSPVVRCITARLDGEAVCTGQFQVDSVPTCTWCFSVPRICWREHLLETKWRMLTLRVSSAV